MKKLTVLFHLLFASLFVQAQTSVYHPFPDSNAVWGVRSWCLQATCGDAADTRYYYTGDTVIGSYSYKKLFGNIVSFTNNGCCDPTFAVGLIGFLRQDTVSKKIYIRNWQGTPADSLFYDFTLQTGDTCKTLACLNCQYNGMVIRSIDSILIGTAYRKRFNFDQLTSCSLSFIEGIGSTGGVFGSCAFFEASSELYCFSQNSILLYNGSHCPGPPYSGLCDIPTSVNEQLLEKNILKIFPNPASDILHIEHNYSGVLRIEVIDIWGVVRYKNWIENTPTTINIASLPTGVYLIKAVNKQESVIKKIIILK